MEKIKKCKACNDPIKWNDEVVEIDEGIYHFDCLDKSKTIVYHYFDVYENYLGDSEDYPNKKAFELLEEDEYLED